MDITDPRPWPGGEWRGLLAEAVATSDEVLDRLQLDPSASRRWGRGGRRVSVPRSGYHEAFWNAFVCRISPIRCSVRCCQLRLRPSLARDSRRIRWENGLRLRWRGCSRNTTVARC